MKRYPDFKISEKSHYEFLHEIGHCAVTGRAYEPIQVAHLRSPLWALGKTETGMGMKPGYWWCLPLCKSEHDKQHKLGEKNYFTQAFWPLEDTERGPLVACMVLTAYSAIGDVEGAQRWMDETRLVRLDRRYQCVR